jgi:hypothetical protein
MGLMLVALADLSLGSPSVQPVDLPKRTVSPLLKRAKEDLCRLIDTALSSGASGESCPGLRERNGDLVLDVVLRDAGTEVRVMRPGQRCPGRYVGVDKRPRKTPRDLSFFELTFSSIDARTMEFELSFVGYTLLPNGEIGGTVGTCNPKASGRVRLSEEGWTQVKVREEGCSK